MFRLTQRRTAADSACTRCGRAWDTPAPMGLCPRCLMETAVAQQPGDLSARSVHPAREFGDYELLESLGEGGQGTVYRARQKSLNRIVALKLLRGGALATSPDAARFRAEAAAAAALRHPGIVGVYEVGERDGQLFYSMELVEGADLGRLVAEEMVSPEWAARCAAKAAEAVHAAHEHGVLHRDLKPSNVLLDAEDAPRITDFGLARRLDEAAHLTLSHQALGTPGYAAPELAAGHHRTASAPTDVYGLGAILYFLLTGRPPFVGDSVPDVLRQVVEREPLAPRALRPAVPRDLETICLKCLRKEPPRRYQTAQALAGDLGRFLRHEPIQARPVSTIERAWRWCRRRPRVAALALGLAGALVALALGSTIAAIWINAARVDERRNHELAERALSEAYLAQARAQRLSGRPGHRFGTLDAVAKAVELGPLTRQRKLELRNEVIAASALVDVRHVWTRQFKLGQEFACFDRTLERCAVLETNALSIRRVADDAELTCLPLPATRRRWRLTEFSPNGRCLSLFARESPPVSQVWDLTTGQRLLEVPGSPPAFSPDSRRLVVCDPAGGVALYDVASSNLVARFAPGVKCGYAAFDGHGERLALHASGADETPDQIILLDAASGAESRRLRLEGKLVTFAWHPNGRHMAVSSDDQRGAIQIYDCTTGSQVKRFSGHGHFVVDLAFNQQGSLLASSSWDSTIRLWSIPAGRELLRVAAGGLPRFAPDGRQMGIQSWDRDALSLFAVAPPPPEARSFELDTEPRDGGESIAYNANGRVLLHTGGGPERALILRNAFTLETFAVLTNQSRRLVSADATGEGFFSTPQQILRLPLEPGSMVDGGEVGRLTANPFTTAELSNDGRWLAGADAESGILLADLRNESPLRRLGDHRGARFIAVSPDGRWVATGAWILNGVKVWNVEQGRLQCDLPTESMANVMFSPDGLWLVTTSERITFWRVGSWEAARQIARPPLERYPSPMAFTRDGRMLAVCPNSRAIRLVNPTTGDELATLELPNPWWIRALSFSPDGSHLAVSGELTREFRVWDLRRLRSRLAAMQLDWDLPPYPPAAH